MPDCPASGQSSNGTKKSEPVWDQTKGTQSGIGMLGYRTEMSKAWMPMPSYDNDRAKNVFIMQK